MSFLGKVAYGIGIGVIALIILAVVSIIAAIPTYYLWNWLMPAIFGIKVITFWQAWGVNFLAGILFKNTSSSSSSKQKPEPKPEQKSAFRSRLEDTLRSRGESRS
jgi:hypothetical protein